MHISDVRTDRDELDFGVADASSLDLDWETCLKVLQGHCLANTRLIRTAVLDGDRSHASYFNAGVRSGSLGGLRRFTQDHALLVKYINLFLQSVFQEATWTSFCVSRNEFAHLHSDFNASGSLNHTCSLGAFEKGGLWIQAPAGFMPQLDRVPPPDVQADVSLRGCLVCTRRQGLSFDGSWPHCSEPLTGDRWVITAYTSSQLGSVSEQELRLLRELSFPLPGEASEALFQSPEDRGLYSRSHPVLPSPPLPLDLSKVQPFSGSICGPRSASIYGFPTCGGFGLVNRYNVVPGS